MSPPRLSAEESGLLQLGAEGHRMALINVALIDGPAPALEEVEERVASLLERFPRYAAAPVPVPFDLQRPVWARRESFRLADHVVRLPIDPPGEPADIEHLIVRLANRPFPSGRPLWDLALVDGLAEGRWLLASRTHLALVDGLRNDDLHTAVLAPERSHDRGRPIPPSPGGLRLMGDAMRDLATSPYEQVRTVSSIMRRFSQPRPRAVPPRGELAYGRVKLSLEDLKAVRAALGGSVNDVLVTLVAAGVHAAETEAAAPTGGAVPTEGAAATEGTARLRTAIPFAVRSLSRPGHYDNQIAVDTVDLPVGAAGSGRPKGAAGQAAAAARYKALSAQLDRFARDNLAVGGKLLTRLNGIAPSLLLALGARACVRQEADISFVNAPGPPAPIAPFGHTMVDAYALAPHPPGVRWSATARSYGETVSISLTAGDRDAVRRAVEAVEAELAALRGASRRAGGTARAAKAGAAKAASTSTRGSKRKE